MSALGWNRYRLIELKNGKRISMLLTVCRYIGNIRTSDIEYTCEEYADKLLILEENFALVVFVNVIYEIRILNG
jgi:hypothetical protein